MKVLAPLLLLLSSLHSLAELKLPKIFSDGMVLQQESSAHIWGWTQPGSSVEITFAGQKYHSKAGAEGKWKIELEGLKANSTGSELTIQSGESKRTIQNVLVGEVWIASGQSNMEWQVSKSHQGEKEVAEATDPLLRVFVSSDAAAKTPQDDFQGNWKDTRSANTGSFTAVGYYFAKRLRAELQVPIGIIACSWGAKPVQAFTSEQALAKLPAGKDLLDMKAKASAAFDPEMANARYQRQIKEHQEKLAAWTANKKGRKPRAPRQPIHPDEDPNMPGVIYNGMIAPIIGYGNRGAIWYQGEANANGGTAEHYEELLGCLISDWRQRWGHDLSFYWVQLANYRKASNKPGIESDWALVQDEMRRALKSIPKSGMAVTNDIGDPRDIHPKNKKDVGERLARWALAKDYGRQDLIVSGPLYSGMEQKNGKITLSFEHAQGLKTRDGKSPQRFEIAGADGQWHWAKAHIVGENIILSHDKLKNPSKARYAWASNPEGANLINSAGLPASCFTTE